MEKGRGKEGERGKDIVTERERNREREKKEKNTER